MANTSSMVAAHRALVFVAGRAEEKFSEWRSRERVSLWEVGSGAPFRLTFLGMERGYRDDRIFSGAAACVAPVLREEAR